MGLTQVRADGGYVGQLVDLAHRLLGMALTVVKRTADVREFIVLPKRWLVERSLVALMEQFGVALAALVHQL